MKDGDVRLVLNKDVAGAAVALVDRVHALDKTMHLTVVDVFSELLAFADPGFGKSITEGLELRKQIGVRDMERTINTDVAQARAIQLVVVVVGGWLIKVLSGLLPVPAGTTEFFPIVKGRGAATDPSVVVQARAAAEDLATGVGLLNTSVVWAIDHGALVRPIVLGATKLKGTGRGGDGWDITRVAEEG